MSYVARANLFDGYGPGYVVGAVDPFDLIKRVRMFAGIESGDLSSLDHVLRQWTMKAIVRKNDVEYLLLLDELIYLCSIKVPNSAEGDGYKSRWRAFRDLLESKMLKIADSRGRSGLLSEQKILELLSHGPVLQSTLCEMLGFCATSVNQHVCVLEAVGLVWVKKTGQCSDNLVGLAST